MIVEPDFLTHWKTQMLVNELGDRCAPLYVIALWAHCQQRKSDTFSNLAPNALKAICRYEGEASKLRSALERSGFIEVNADAIVVHGWAETNMKLVTNWTNGSKGGRPRKTQEKPTENPNQDRANPSEIDREDKIDKNLEEREKAPARNPAAGTRRPTLAQAKSAAANLGITPEKADEWWHAREASEWLKGMAGGGTAPVGTNWHADLKTYASRGAQGNSARAEFTQPPKPQTELAWE